MPKSVSDQISEEERKGIKAGIYAIFGILILFILIMFTGRHIAAFGTLEASTVYSILVYIPVIIVCVIALMRIRKLGRI